MNRGEDLVSGKTSLRTAVPEAQTSLWNVEMSVPVITEVKIEFTEEKSPWSNSMIPSEPLQSPEYINYYDSNTDVLKQLKMELSEEESPESGCSYGSDILFEDEKILKLKGNQRDSQNNNTGDIFFPNGKIKEEDKMYQASIETEKIEDHEEPNQKYYVTIKTERLDGEEQLETARNTSVHYDALVTPERVQCKWCGRPFKNSFNLLKHNIEHLKLDINTPPRRIKNEGIHHKKCTKLKSNDTNGSYNCNYCDKAFKQYSSKHIHMNTVHSKRKYYCDLCGKHFRCKQYIRTHMQSIHLPEMRANNLKCQYCDVVLKHKYNLHCHVKTLHNNDIFKCESCDAVFKCKQYLIIHCKRMHYNYGRTFPCCWCEKEFRTPFHLHDHTKRIHVDLIKRQKAGVAVNKNT